MDPVDQLHFRPSHARELRLRTIGFSNHAAAVSGMISLDINKAEIITKALVGLRHEFTISSRKLFENGQLRLSPIRISYRGAITWPAQPNIFADLEVSEIERWFQENKVDKVEAPVVMYLFCPVCQTMKDIAKTKLYFKGKWTSIACLHRTCRTIATSRKWKCHCGVLWHQCPHHANRGHACDRPPKRERSNIAANDAEGHIEEDPPNSRPAIRRRINTCALVPDGSIAPITAPGIVIRARFPRVFDG